MVDTIYVEDEIIGTKKAQEISQSLDMQKLQVSKDLERYLIHQTRISGFRKQTLL